MASTRGCADATIMLPGTRPRTAGGGGRGAPHPRRGCGTPRVPPAARVDHVLVAALRQIGDGFTHDGTGHAAVSKLRIHGPVVGAGQDGGVARAVVLPAGAV